MNLSTFLGLHRFVVCANMEQLIQMITFHSAEAWCVGMELFGFKLEIDVFQPFMIQFKVLLTER